MRHSHLRSAWWPWLAGVAVAAALGVVVAGVGASGSPWAMSPSSSVTPHPTGPAIAPITASGSAAPAPVPSIGVSPVFSLTQYSIDDPESPWVLVSKKRPLDPAEYVPPDLVSLGDMSGGGGQQMRREAAEALRRMYDDARADGAPFSLSTAYRSYSFQSSLYYGYVNERGQAAADTFSARPGYSEHQTGWAVDVCTSAPCRLTTGFANETAGRWIDAHLWEYGFMLRYDEGQSSTTGYIYEPWHLRYVGVELAEHWHQEGRPPLEDIFGLGPADSY